jgi:phosphoadenosine phosphosulfate reductase
MTRLALKLEGDMSISISRLQTFYGHLGAHDLLSSMIHDEFKGEIALLSSFGADAAMMIALVAEVDNNVPILFLETDKHFPETLDYVNQLRDRFNLTNIQYLKPSEKLAGNIDKNGELWKNQPNRCCWLRKVEPLDRAIEESGYKAIITGRKGYQTRDRESVPSIELDEKGLVKINPVIHWDKQRFKDEFETRDLPTHPLVSKGYLSIGCMPCTRPVKEGEDPRAGRWAHTAEVTGSDGKKVECGIHIAKNDAPDWSV